MAWMREKLGRPLTAIEVAAMFALSLREQAAIMSRRAEKEAEAEPSRGAEAPTNQPSKRPRVEQDEPAAPAASVSAGPSRLTPEQLERVQKNKAEAQRRLLARLGGLVPAEIPAAWRMALAPEVAKPYFAQLMAFVEQERTHHTVFPPPGQVFTWARLCDFHDVKVVILGDEASSCPPDQGLAFSRPKYAHLSRRLEEMYTELANSIEGFSHPGHGDLTGWAKQGVLLLNEVLTVREHAPGSHRERGWERFTGAVLSCLSRERENLVFLLWGPRACQKGRGISRERHTVLEAGSRGEHNALLGCKHFSRTDALLEAFDKEPIQWAAL